MPANDHPDFLADSLQQAAADLLGSLSQRAKRAWQAQHGPGLAAAGGAAAEPWVVGMESWSDQLLATLGALLAGPSLVLRWV